MFNNVTLIGYLGSDAESRTTRNNSTLAVLSLATKRTWKNRETGERESQTTWHRCVVFGRMAE
jgi:single-strand DNA-binding protein